MVKFAVLFAFPEPAFEMAMQRLQRLIFFNPGVNFFPIIGPRQYFYVPMIIDKYMFGSSPKTLPLSSALHTINYLALSAPGVFQLSTMLNKRIFAFAKSNAFAEMCSRTKQMGLPPLHVDFTPIALWNLDHTIMSWFKTTGEQSEFDYLIFYESDIFTTKPLEMIYEKYTRLHDACFVDFDIATPSWHFYNFPLGFRRATMRWLRQRKLPPTVYRSMFAGALISRRCLERLGELGIDFSGEPLCQNEMRLPTLLNAIGFRVGRLDFSSIRHRPEWSSNEILAHKNAGIFHPVKQLVSTKTKNSSS